jgi:hypothetical protein
VYDVWHVMVVCHWVYRVLEDIRKVWNCSGNELPVRHWLDETFPGRWTGRGGGDSTVGCKITRCVSNLLRFSGYLKSQVPSVKIATVAHLKQRVEELCQSITADMLQKLQNVVKFHLQICLETGWVYWKNSVYNFINKVFPLWLQTFRTVCR